MMSEPEPCGREGDGGEEVAGQLVVAGGDAAEVLELVEEAFDEVALPVHGFVDGALDLAGPVRGDVSASSEAFDVRHDSFAVVAAVADDIAAGHWTVQQFRHGSHVMRLSGGEGEIVRQAASVHHGVDLGAQSSTRTANGVIRAPFFPPAAC